MTVNICFHGIGTPERALEPGEDAYWISPYLYEQVLDEVAGRADVRLSFDDGNRSDVDIALQGLLDRGLTATFFPLAGRLETGGSLDPADLRALRAAGMNVGSHGMDHRPWRGLTPSERRRELVEAREQLSEAAGAPIEEVALPLGRYDRDVLGALRATGYRRVHSSDRRPARPAAWLQPRYSVRRGDTLESVRRDILTPPAPLRRLRSEAVGVVKRLR